MSYKFDRLPSLSAFNRTLFHSIHLIGATTKAGLRCSVLHPTDFSLTKREQKIMIEVNSEQVYTFARKIIDELIDDVFDDDDFDSSKIIRFNFLSFVFLIKG